MYVTHCPIVIHLCATYGKTVKGPKSCCLNRKTRQKHHIRIMNVCDTLSQCAKYSMPMSKLKSYGTKMSLHGQTDGRINRQMDKESNSLIKTETEVR